MQGFNGLKRKKKTKSGWENVNCIKWELSLSFIHGCSSLSLFFNFQRYTLKITDESQFKQNNLLQKLYKGFETFYLTVCDFIFQPVVRYLYICDKCIQ